MLGEVLREPFWASLVMHPTYWAKVRPFHDIEVWGARFNNLKQNARSTEILSHRSWKMATKPCDRKQDLSGFVRKDHQNMKKITTILTQKLLTFGRNTGMA